MIVDTGWSQPTLACNGACVCMYVHVYIPICQAYSTGRLFSSVVEGEDGDVGHQRQVGKWDTFYIYTGFHLCCQSIADGRVLTVFMHAWWHRCTNASLLQTVAWQHPTHAWQHIYTCAHKLVYINCSNETTHVHCIQLLSPANNVCQQSVQYYNCAFCAI